MIYISSACIRDSKMVNTLNRLYHLGFSNIEFSGVTQYCESLLPEIQDWKKDKEVSFLTHNYFPPPQKPFILNFAATDDNTHFQSMEHMVRTIWYSHLLGGEKVAFHAPFLMEIPIEQIGKKIDRFELYDKEVVQQRFFQVLEVITKYAGIFNISIYIENNVYSAKNFENYGYDIPFLLLNAEEYATLSEIQHFQLLLDVAHLKVSCKTLGLNFYDQLSKLLPYTNYVHISDNDGTADTNQAFRKDSTLFEILSTFSWKDKTITLETYTSEDLIRTSYETAELLF